VLQAHCVDGVEPSPIDRREIIRKMAAYAERQIAGGARLHHVSRHLFGLYAGQPGAARWRRYLAEVAARRDSGADELLHSLEIFEAAA
jgi:tRNA-dihydrouridine synthase A